MRPLKLSQKAFCIGLPGRDMRSADAFGLAPSANGIRGELGAVVGYDGPRTAVWESITADWKYMGRDLEGLEGNAFPLVGAAVADAPTSAGDPRNAPLE